MHNQQRRFLVQFLLFLGCFLFFIGTANALDIFITSDSISGNSTQDVSNLKSIKGYIENGSLQNQTNLNITVDPIAPKPGEGERAVYTVKVNGVAVYLAASCPGTMKAVAKYAAVNNKGVIFVNTGSLDLKNTSILRRSWDDNFSDIYFAGIKTPYIFLRKAGVYIIQPNVARPGGTQDQKNEYIAKTISYFISTYPSMASKVGRYYDSNLILYHEVSPATLAKVSQGIYNSNNYKQALQSSYSGYRLPTFLYMVTSYMNGPIYKPIYGYFNSPSDTHVKSTYTGTISRSEYRSIATSVNSYMRTYKKPPSYVKFKGKIIGYKDLLLMYATLTKDHTSKSGMTLASSYSFRKVWVY